MLTASTSLRLLAEAQAWPYLSKVAVAERLIALSRDPETYEPDGSTQQLGRELEERLRLRGPGLSLDVLRSYRDAAWFSNADAKQPLTEHLLQLAASFLIPTADCTLLREEGDATARYERLLHWRWLTLKLPADLLLSARFAAESQRPTTDALVIAQPEAKDLSDFAETHLHAKAAVSFSWLWTAWMGWLHQTWVRQKAVDKILAHGNALLGPNVDEVDRALKEGLPDFETPRDLLKQVTAAATLRLLLAAMLQQKHTAAFTLAKGWLEQLPFMPPDWLDAFAQHVAPLGLRIDGCPNGPPAKQYGASEKADGVTDKKHEIESPVAVSYRDLRSKLGFSSKTKTHATSLRALSERDPVRGFGFGTDERAPEVDFAAACFKEIRDGKASEDFAKAFWQYERFRCRVFALMVQEAGTSGLSWFNRHYQRTIAMRAPLEGVIFPTAMDGARGGRSPRSVELRYALARPEREIFPLLRSLDAEAEVPTPDTGGSPREIAVVFHLIKSRPPRPQDENLYCPMRKWVGSQLNEAQRLGLLLQRSPSLLYLVRGIDVAGPELAMPTWAICLPLKRLREDAQQAYAKLQETRFVQKDAHFRMTCHVGEDFIRLSEGVRRVDELVSFAGVLQKKDRLGHVLALGIDPHRWNRSHPQLMQPAQDRLDDLLWRIAVHRRELNEFGPPPSEVEEQAKKLINEIYGEPVGLEAHFKAWQMRFDDSALDGVGFPESPVGTDGGDPILKRYLYDGDVRRRGLKPTFVPASDDEAAFLAKVQSMLRKKLIEMEITIEANPTSNLLIGNLDHFGEHPVLCVEEGTHAEWPSVSINSDDPLSFATCLSDEYAYVHHAWMAKMEPHKAVKRTQDVAKASWESRFSIPIDWTQRAALFDDCAPGWRPREI